jgi:hypothetical protein
MEDPLRKLEPRLKQVLYKSLESIRATKAALYLSREGQPYELVTQYGFKNGPVRKIQGHHPIPARLILTRAPFFINGMKKEMKFAEILYDTDSETLLAAPLFAKGQLIGFIDMRDKSGRQAFTEEDLESSTSVAQGMFELFAAERLFGLKGVTEETPAEKKPARVELKRLIETARQAVNRHIHENTSLGSYLTEEEIQPVETALHTILTLPGVVLASFSAFGHLGNVQPVVAVSTLTDDAIEKLEAKLRSWLERQGVEIPSEPSRTRITYPLGQSSPPVTGVRLASILSAPVKVENMTGLVLSVGFETPPERETQQKLTRYLDQIQQTIVYSISHHALRSMRQTAAERLLEPDFMQYPKLVEHSRRVSTLADQFAQYLDLPPSEVEEIRLAGYVHDVGMRLLDYENIYTKGELTDDEMDLVRQHPVVSAALIARSPLGRDVAEIVLYHHERADGEGYPEGLKAAQTPLPAKVLGICEAFVAMTATDGYQPPMPESAAILQIERSAGTQFDRELALKFVEMLAAGSRG